MRELREQGAGLQAQLDLLQAERSLMPGEGVEAQLASVSLALDAQREAIELADRVVVLDDGKIAADIAVDLPKEGRARQVRAAELRRQLLAYLGVEDPLAVGSEPTPIRAAI